MPRDISSPAWLYAKAGLFLLLGLLSSALLLIPHFSWRNLALLLLALWAFCRAYYFVFYVIQHYVDPEYRFAGLLDFLLYAIRRHRPTRR